MKRILLAILIAQAFSGCVQKDSSEAQQEMLSENDNIVKVSPQQEKAAGISMGKLEKRIINKTLQVNGVIDVPPQNMVVIAPHIGGFVRSTTVKEGMRVKKGELLVTLENLEYIQIQQDYLENSSRLEFLEAEFERQKELARENINAGKNLQMAKSNFEVTTATLKALEARLRLLNLSPENVLKGDIRSRINLYAPVSGFVSSVQISVGQFFGTAEPMLKIVNMDHIHLRLHVYERDIASIREGQKVLFRIGDQSATHEATVYLIGKEITPEKTVLVHCHLSDETIPLIPGMYVSAFIAIASSEADVLPMESVVTFGEKHLIFTATESKGEYIMVEVAPGQSSGDVVEVSLPAGFKRDTPVVTSGAGILLGLLKNNEEE